MNIYETFELRRIFGYMDALQVRADNQIFSKESDRRSTPSEQLTKVFGVPHLSNGACDAILKEVHRNYITLARHVLPLDV